MKPFAQSINFLGIEVAGEEETHPSRPLNFPIDSTTLSGSKTQHQSYLDLGKRNSHQSYKPKRRLKSEKLETRYKTQEKLVRLLTEVGEDKTAENMDLCGQSYGVLTCDDHIASKVANHRCNVRYCSLCAGRRSSKYRRKYLPYALEFVKLSSVKLTPCLLTLTQRKIKGEELVDSRDRMLKSFRKFVRHVFFKDYFAGGLFAVENTVSEEGNHLHLHIVAFRKKFIDHKLLKEQWSLVSPGAENLNIRRIDDLESGLRECVKYISKPIDVHKFEKKHLLELLKLRGKNMIGAFGEFRKFCTNHILVESEAEVEEQEREKLEPGQCCPRCDKGLYHVTLSAEELVAFYRRIEQVERGSPATESHRNQATSP
jgi:hypothetical protein